MQQEWTKIIDSTAVSLPRIEKLGFREARKLVQDHNENEWMHLY
jgi:hypothetical protein